MMERLLQICFRNFSLLALLATGLHAQCASPTGTLGTAFDCKMPAGKALDGSKAYLDQRSKGAPVKVEKVAEDKTKLTSKTDAETVLVWLEDRGEAGVRLRVEVQPQGRMPLLGPSSDAARALGRYLNEWAALGDRGVH